VPSNRTSANERVEQLQRWLATLRIGLGWVFFWPFLDKTFGLGFATSPSNAWIRGGSPTNGFLSFATRGPLADLFQAIAGHPLVDALFMIGLLAIGLALMLGIGMRLAVYGGSLMLFLMWLAVLPPENNPVLDDHIVYILALFSCLAGSAGRTWGLGDWWVQTEIVRRYPILR